jgi:3-methyladenine DNA glycosylase/8-oxoguanine DNA glycosylase
VTTAIRPLTRRRLDEAQAALAARDARLGDVIARVGPCTMVPNREGTHFGHLVRTITYQQLSTGAAATIHGRFVAMIGGEPGAPDPAAILALPDEALRACGLSAAKTRAIRDLAEHVADGRLPLHALDTMTDDEVIQALVPVRGIGPWTAQMFLIFRLGRPDVLPVLDLGVRKGAQRIYRTRALPDAARLEKLARNWRPWASVASWYCWRVLELNDAAGA